MCEYIYIYICTCIYIYNTFNKQQFDGKMTYFADEHSPDKFRVNGPLSQNLDFQSDWECPANSKMNPPNKCALW